MPVATFSSRVELVRVPVVVLDDRGEYVHGLRAENFVLWEEGQQQRIDSLIEVDAPVSVGLEGYEVRARPSYTGADPSTGC